MNGNKVLSGLLALIVTVFIVGLAYLFQLRYESGDVYPPYSSLRTDPLGTKAFFESLQRVGGLTARRNMFSLEKLNLPRSTAVLYIALDAEDLHRVEEREFKQWEDIVLGGGRLVLSFEPRRTNPDPPRQTHPPDIQPPDEPFALKKTALPAERWGFGIAHEALPKDDKGNYGSVEVHRAAGAPLPFALAWHSSMVFSQVDGAWRTIYARGDWPVLMEKRHGRGSIVLCADSYLLSNEAMRLDRQPELLSWLIGGSRSVVFDETHFGVIENPGVMALARKYRLHGAFIGLALLAGLFVWKNAFSFMPEFGESKSELRYERIGGRDSTSGFINMLRRSVPPGELLDACFKQWQAGHSGEKSRGKLQQMEALVQGEQARPPRERDPVGMYRRLARIWNDRKL